MKLLIFSLFSFIISISIWAEKEFEIHRFKVKDFSNHQYQIAIMANNSKALEYFKQNKFQIVFSHSNQEKYLLEYEREAMYQESGEESFTNAYLKAKTNIPSGSGALEIYTNTDPNVLISEPYQYTIPEHSKNKPVVIDFEPKIGAIGEFITLTGKHFSPKKAENQLFFRLQDHGKDSMEKKKRYYPVVPVSLQYNKEEDIYRATFKIPDSLVTELSHRDLKQDKYSAKMIENISHKDYRLSFYSNNYKTKFDVSDNFILLKRGWHHYLIIASFGIVICIFSFVLFLFRKKFPPKSILLSASGHNYSLFRFHALLWGLTIVSILFYLIVYILASNRPFSIIPNTLFYLTFIIVSGLAAFEMYDRKIHSSPERKKPSNKDLLLYGGTIDFIKLQLLSFSFISYTLYIFNLWNYDKSGFVPEIPDNLIYLLLISQTSYLAVKAMRTRFAFHKITPSTFASSAEYYNIEIHGYGFSEDTMVMVEGGELTKPEHIDKKKIVCKVSGKMLPGKKGITITGCGSPKHITDAIEVVKK